MDVNPFQARNSTLWGVHYCGNILAEEVSINQKILMLRNDMPINASYVVD